MKKSLRKAIQAHTEREVPCTENGLYYEVIHGKSHRVLRSLPDHCIDAYVSDPPAGIEFLGASWDSFSTRDNPRENKERTWSHRPGTPFARNGSPNYTGRGVARDTQAREAFIKAMGKTFKEVLRVLKPGAYALVWALPRTSHWTTTALEDAGFEIRDVLTHVNVQGMPKGQDLGRMIARRNGGELQAKKAVAFMKARREELGLTRQQFETRIFGKSNGNVRNWEDGISIPKPGLWPKIRKAMKLKTTPFDADMERGDKVVSVEKGNYGYQKGGERWEKNREIRTPTSDLAKKWDGWSTTLKPCGEHWILARAPIAEGTTVANVLTHGTGALNIDACRVKGVPSDASSKGRWPPNFLLSHHPACEAVGTKKVKAHGIPTFGKSPSTKNSFGAYVERSLVSHGDGDGTVSVPSWKCHEDCPVRHLEAQGPGTSRSFPQFTFDPVYDVPFGFHSKPSRSEKNHQGQVENHHPTVKSISLCAWLVSLVTPPGGVVLDTFFGSGTTGVACLKNGFHVLGIEQNRDFHKLGRKRLRLTAKEAKPELMKALFAPRSPK